MLLRETRKSWRNTTHVANTRPDRESRSYRAGRAIGQLARGQKPTKYTEPATPNPFVGKKNVANISAVKEGKRVEFAYDQDTADLYAVNYGFASDQGKIKQPTGGIRYTKIANVKEYQPVSYGIQHGPAGTTRNEAIKGRKYTGLDAVVKGLRDDSADVYVLDKTPAKQKKASTIGGTPDWRSPLQPYGEFVDPRRRHEMPLGVNPFDSSAPTRKANEARNMFWRRAGAASDPEKRAREVMGRGTAQDTIAKVRGIQPPPQQPPPQSGGPTGPAPKGPSGSGGPIKPVMGQGRFSWGKGGPTGQTGTPPKPSGPSGPPPGQTPGPQPSQNQANPPVPFSPPPSSNPGGTAIAPPNTPRHRKFTTAKGSSYELHEDWTTTRTKSQRPEHPGDFGVKERSAKTVYVSPSIASEIGMWNSGQNVSGRRIKLANGRIIRISKPGGAAKHGNDKFAENPIYKTEPELGLSPLELWHEDPDMPGFYRSNHPGNPITAFDEEFKPQSPQAAEDTSDRDISLPPPGQNPETTDVRTPGRKWRRKTWGKDPFDDMESNEFQDRFRPGQPPTEADKAKAIVDQYIASTDKPDVTIDPSIFGDIVDTNASQTSRVPAATQTTNVGATDNLTETQLRAFDRLNLSGDEIRKALASGAGRPYRLSPETTKDIDQLHQQNLMGVGPGTFDDENLNGLTRDEIKLLANAYSNAGLSAAGMQPPPKMLSNPFEYSTENIGAEAISPEFLREGIKTSGDVQIAGLRALAQPFIDTHNATSDPGQKAALAQAIKHRFAEPVDSLQIQRDLLQRANEARAAKNPASAKEYEKTANMWADSSFRNSPAAIDAFRTHSTDYPDSLDMGQNPEGQPRSLAGQFAISTNSPMGGTNRLNNKQMADIQRRIDNGEIDESRMNALAKKQAFKDDFLDAGFTSEEAALLRDYLAYKDQRDVLDSKKDYARTTGQKFKGEDLSSIKGYQNYSYTLATPPTANTLEDFYSQVPTHMYRDLADETDFDRFLTEGVDRNATRQMEVPVQMWLRNQTKTKLSEEISSAIARRLAAATHGAASKAGYAQEFGDAARQQDVFQAQEGRGEDAGSGPQTGKHWRSMDVVEKMRWNLEHGTGKVPGMEALAQKTYDETYQRMLPEAQAFLQGLTPEEAADDRIVNYFIRHMTSEEMARSATAATYPELDTSGLHNIFRMPNDSSLQQDDRSRASLQDLVNADLPNLINPPHKYLSPHDALMARLNDELNGGRTDNEATQNLMNYDQSLADAELAQRRTFWEGTLQESGDKPYMRRMAEMQLAALNQREPVERSAQAPDMTTLSDEIAAIPEQLPELPEGVSIADSSKTPAKLTTGLGRRGRREAPASKAEPVGVEKPLTRDQLIHKRNQGLIDKGLADIASGKRKTFSAADFMSPASTYKLNFQFGDPDAASQPSGIASDKQGSRQMRDLFKQGDWRKKPGYRENANPNTIHADQLMIGDQLTFEDPAKKRSKQKFEVGEVVDIDPSTGVVKIQDGDKFGTIYMDPEDPATSQIRYVEHMRNPDAQPRPQRSRSELYPEPMADPYPDPYVGPASGAPPGNLDTLAPTGKISYDSLLEQLRALKAGSQPVPEVNPPESTNPSSGTSGKKSGKRGGTVGINSEAMDNLHGSIIQQIVQGTIKIKSRSEADKAAKRRGLKYAAGYDNAGAVGSSWSNKIFSKDGMTPDEAHAHFVENGLMSPDSTPDDMFDLIGKGINAYYGQVEEVNNRKVAEKQYANVEKHVFDPKAAKRKSNPNPIAVKADDLMVGSTLELASSNQGKRKGKTETAEVVDIDEYGNVMVEDGDEFGKFPVKAGQTIYAKSVKHPNPEDAGPDPWDNPAQSGYMPDPEELLRKFREYQRDKRRKPDVPF